MFVTVSKILQVKLILIVVYLKSILKASFSHTPRAVKMSNYIRKGNDDRGSQLQKELQPLDYLLYSEVWCY